MDFPIFSNIFSFIYMEFPSFEAMCFGRSAEEQMPCKTKKKSFFIFDHWILSPCLCWMPVCFCRTTWRKEKHIALWKRATNKANGLHSRILFLIPPAQIPWPVCDMQGIPRGGRGTGRGGLAETKGQNKEALLGRALRPQGKREVHGLQEKVPINRGPTHLYPTYLRVN